CDGDAGRARGHQEGQEGRRRGGGCGRSSQEGREEEVTRSAAGNRQSSVVKLIAGLGNPGAKYKGTRHNIGFEVIDELARRAGIGFEAAPADALIAKWRASDALLVKPLTFMNL